MLLFYVGNDRYALSVQNVAEVVPMVALQKLYKAPDYIAGLLNYRGQIVPVVDLCVLLQERPCHSHLSTRIILLERPDFRSDRASNFIGLMAERVTETVNILESDFIDPGLSVENTPYLGGIIADEQGTIQTIHVERLLPQLQVSYLLP